jgi:hypothetical protein
MCYDNDASEREAYRMADLIRAHNTVNLLVRHKHLVYRRQ